MYYIVLFLPEIKCVLNFIQQISNTKKLLIVSAFNTSLDEIFGYESCLI